MVKTPALLHAPFTCPSAVMMQRVLLARAHTHGGVSVAKAPGWKHTGTASSGGAAAAAAAAAGGGGGERGGRSFCGHTKARYQPLKAGRASRVGGR